MDNDEKQRKGDEIIAEATTKAFEAELDRICEEEKLQEEIEAERYEERAESELFALLREWESVPTHLVPFEYELAPGVMLKAVKGLPEEAEGQYKRLSWDEYLNSMHLLNLWGCVDPVKLQTLPNIDVDGTCRSIFGASKPLETITLFRDLLSLGDVEDLHVIDATLHICHTMQQYCGIEGIGNYLDFVKKLAAFQVAMTSICTQLPSGRVVLQDGIDLAQHLEAKKAYRFLCQNVEYIQSWYAQANLWGKQAAVICRLNQLHLKRVLGLAPIEQKAELFDSFHMQLSDACKKLLHFGKILENNSIIA